MELNCPKPKFDNITIYEEIIMKIKTKVCKNCGHEKKIKVYTAEEARQKRIHINRPICENCGSTNVELRD